MSLHAKWTALRDEIAGMYLERDAQIEGIILAVLSGQHVLLLGLPGTAKSAVIKTLTKRIRGAKLFEKQLTKFTGPEEVFGPTSIAGLQNDVFERRVDGYMPVADFGYIDECFKANSAILNSFLSIMAEREFKNGTEMISCPLISMIGASNETPQDESLAAMYDRFMLKYVSTYVNDNSFATLMLMGPVIEKAEANPNKVVFTLDDLKESSARVRAVKLSPNIGETLAQLRAECRKEGFSASDRRWMASVRVLQASAFLDGRDEVNTDDLMIYKDILWDDMNRAAKCGAVVARLVNPVLAQIQEHVDAIDIILKEFKAKGGGENNAVDAWAKINSHQNKLVDLNGGEKGEKLKAHIEARCLETVASAFKMRRKSVGA